jgi:RNA recognition motif-containing protein
MDRNTSQSRGFGFVEMSTSEEALKAISALNGRQNGGRSLIDNESKPRESNGGGSYGGGRSSGSNRY